MKKAFVTGGSGFIGRALIRQLCDKGVQVKALARSDYSAQVLRGLGADPVIGQLNNRSLLWSEMRGCDVVFHLAGWQRRRSTDWREAELVNVVGTRHVLEAAVEASVPKIVYTSTLAIFGDTKGHLPDETYVGPNTFLSHYDRTKWLAYYDVVQPLVAKGAPIVAVIPGLAYGPDNHSPLGQLMRRFVKNALPFPFLPGPNTIYTFAHVDDIAAGHVLAADKGRIGESYILAGPPVALGEMVDFWARLTGRPVPTFHVPASIIKLALPLVEILESYLDWPAVFSSEVIKTLGTSQMGSAKKAEEELGWRQRPLRSGLLDTFATVSLEVADHPHPVARDREIATVSLAVAAGILVGWLFYRAIRRRGKK